VSIDHTKWYIDNRPVYEPLLNTISSLINALLIRERIIIYQIKYRVKEFKSFEEKLVNKRYAHPQDMTDFAALRVICYLKRDVQVITSLLADNFDIIKREDKVSELGIDRVGYNAVHLDATLKNNRISLPEYDRFAGLNFEIQIVTVLQHAYAEIERDLVYKSGDVLPENIVRQIRLMSGALENADQMFENIIKEIDEYKNKSNYQIENQRLDMPIDSPSLRRYLIKKFGDIPDFKAQYGSVKDRDVIDQLHAMGITTLADFEKIIPPDFKEKYLEVPGSKYGTYATGLVVWLLIIHDYKKYFNEVYKKSYGIFDAHDYYVFKKFGLDTSKFPTDLFDCD
jgi:putative GTP pyrophosphokinase